MYQEEDTSIFFWTQGFYFFKSQVALGFLSLCVRQSCNRAATELKELQQSCNRASLSVYDQLVLLVDQFFLYTQGAQVFLSLRTTS
jgi:hypothetical protein